MPNIKPAQKHHLDEILEINKIIDYGNPKEFIEESIDLWRVEVYIKGDRVVAFSLYQSIWWNTLFLALVKVLPNYQWNGIGVSMVRSFEDKMKEEWYKEYMSSTEKINILSQNFHDKLWFTKIGNLDMPHGEEIFYIKKL